ncbi:MAG TPA: exodeoxyribonuclease VII small subunit [Candidatus Binataceae bacterium]|nr:exodeoxyribonuclease VII small subunit [Candidatus Binataceae bacterium]
MATPTKAKKFEEELKDLEEIVGKIDSGELTLEDSIGAFERGVALVRTLNQKLDEIEKKVEVLSRNYQGDLRTTPYEGEDGTSTPPARRESPAVERTAPNPNPPAKSAHAKTGDEDDDIPF